METLYPTTTETGDLLCLILDLNPIAWSHSAKSSPDGDSLSLESALKQILIFCNAHLALRHENQLAVFAAGTGKSKLLFSTSILPPASSVENSAISMRDSNTYQQFSMVDQKITEGVKTIMAEIDDTLENLSSSLVGALAMSLCHINRINATSTLTTSLIKPKPRIVILSVTEDESSQYVAMMNCIFSAQKVSMPIDVCKIYGPNAVFLQQACHLTSGSYYKLAKRSGLLQYLIMAFLPGPTARKYLIAPTQEEVDLRAACFCHRKVVDIGYVCSVCLSIFCNPIPVCSTCRTKFPMSTLKRFGPGPKPASSTNGNRLVKKRKLVPSGNGTSSTPISAAPSPLSSSQNV